MSVEALEKYEAYLRNDPISPELAALRDGVEDAVDVAPAPVKAEIRNPVRDLKRRERQELKEAVRSEGWQVVLRIQEKLDQTHEKCAISMSQENPLKNRDRIAEEWAYRAMFQRAMVELNLAIDKELAEHDREDGR